MRNLAMVNETVAKITLHHLDELMVRRVKNILETPSAAEYFLLTKGTAAQRIRKLKKKYPKWDGHSLTMPAIGGWD